MKKLFILAAFLVGSSVFAADISQKEKDVLVVHVKKALLDEENGTEFQALSRMVGDNPKLKGLQDSAFFDGYSLKTVLGLADYRLFSNTNAVAALLGIVLPKPILDEQQAVAHLMEEGDNLGDQEFALNLVKHAYAKHIINVDRHFVNLEKSSGKLQSLGSFIEDRKNFASRYWGKLLEIVQEGRQNTEYKALFDQTIFFDLVRSFLTNNNHAEFNLRAYIKTITDLDLSALASPVQGISFGQFIDELNPDIFERRDALLRVIAPSRSLPQQAAPADDHAKALKKNRTVAQLLHDYIKKNSWLDLDALTKIYKKHALCVDDQGGFDDATKTFGQEIDALAHDKSNSSPLEALSIQNLVKRERKLDPQVEQQFKDLVLKCLAADENSITIEQLSNCISQNSITAEKIASMTIPVSKKSSMNLNAFITKMSHNLLPNKRAIMETLQKGTIYSYDELDEEQNKECEGYLKTISLEVPSLKPLYQQALKNFNELYPISQTLNSNSAKPQATEVLRISSVPTTTGQEKAVNHPSTQALAADTRLKTVKHSDTTELVDGNSSGAFWKKVVIGSSVIAVVAILIHNLTTRSTQNKNGMQHP